MDSVINLNLLKQPLNWIIVPLIVLFSLQLISVLTAQLAQPQEI